MEEKHILNKHETARLADGGEESVENAGGHKRIEIRRTCAPGGRRGGDKEKPEHDGETAKIGTGHDG